MSNTSASTAWEPPSPDELQEMLPQYEISGFLGRGGMGAVYRGRQVKLNRDVAIKLLPESLAGGNDELNFVARFEQEAQAMARLDHPAIVSVFDFGETPAGQLYFVMEFVDGMDIHQYLAANDGQLSQEHALAIASHVLDALEYAHSNGIVHRDIKPANVLLDQRGRVKIADFGLAKRFADDEEGNSGPALTMANVAVGTPDFVAPEALEDGRIPDHRADIYAVGVMLYQMLTGALPRGQFKTPTEHRPEIDPRLDGIVSRALQANPDDRYASATEIRGDLDAVLSQPIAKVEPAEKTGQDPAATPGAVPGKTVQAGATDRSKTPLLAGIAIFAAALLIGSLFLMKRGNDADDHAGAGPVADAVSANDVVSPRATGVKQADSDTDSKLTAQPEQEISAIPEPVTLATSSPAVVPADPAPKPAADPTAPPTTTPDAEPRPVASASPPQPPRIPAAADTAPVPLKAEPEPRPQATFPELEDLLTRYLKARQTRIEGLAANYGRALSSRQEAAADAGDLQLLKSFRQEAAAVEALRKALTGNTGDDLFGQVRSAATLPELPEASPGGLLTLRKTWTIERGKIQAELDQQLATGLQELEKDMTRQRELEKAEKVFAFRNSLTAPTAIASSEKPPATPPAPVEAPRSNPAAASALPAENPFGWKPIPDEPFPLTRPQRQPTPCRLVAWRADGEAVDEVHFRELFGGVPADLSEIVDFDSHPSLSEKSQQVARDFALLAIRADGSVAAMRWDEAEMQKQAELRDAVKVSVGRFASIVLRSDGTVVPLRRHLRGWPPDVDLDAALSWKDIARISAGSHQIGAVTTDGRPLFAGDNKFKQLVAPADLHSQILDVDLTNEYSTAALVQLLEDGYRFERYGRYAQSATWQSGTRWFLGLDSYSTDRQGRLEWTTVLAHRANSVDSIRSGEPRDVIRVEGASNYNPGVEDTALAAACSRNDEWKFWGDASHVGGYDNKYCNEKARGAWKLRIMYPYVVALKPVAKLTPEDWTGSATSQTGSPTPSPKTTPTPPAPPPASAAAAPSANPFGWEPIPDNPFPLARPQRQTTPCQLVAWRADGERIDEQHFRELFGGVPADLGEIIDYDANPSIFDESRQHPMACALLAIRADGTVAVMRWPGFNEGPEKEPLMRDVVATSVGRFASILLRADGSVVTIMGNPGAFKNDGIDLAATSQWQNVVRVSAGDFAVAGVTADGKPLFAGDNRRGQDSPPADLQSRILDVDVRNSSMSATVVQPIDDGLRIVRFGQFPQTVQRPAGTRYFLGWDFFGTDRQGRLDLCSASETRPNSIESIRGAAPRDVIRVDHAEDYHSDFQAAIAAACSKNDQWQFWGAATGVGGFDASYCNEKAEGSWKLTIMYPYVVALKPTTKLTADDWTGGE